MDLKLAGKRALVLGASAGIGKAVGRVLAVEGARVALVSRDGSRLEAARVEVGAEVAFSMDLSQPRAGRGAVEHARKALGGVDILVVNTGGPPKGSFLELGDEAWAVAFQSLWLGAVDAMRAAIPAMVEARFGRVIVVTSVAAREPMSGLTLSNGLRAGIHGLVKSITREVGVTACGVTVNCLMPGFTDTDRLRQIGGVSDEVLRDIPARRLGKPEEFAALAAFLASEHAGYITGQMIAVDGGYCHGQ
jgi:3-oxoacyl-[acyl-carrier protein] reductase